MIAVLIVFVICAIPTFILGLFIRKGKGLMLISGYNTLPKALRDTIDKRWLSRSAGNMIIRLSVELVLLGVVLFFEIPFAFFIVFAILMIDSTVSSIRIYSRFPKTKMNVWSLRILMAITVAMLIGMPVLFYFGEREPNVFIYESSFRIDGMYGTEVPISTIRDIALIELSMRDIGTGMRRNGYSLGNTLKGHFGSGLLFVAASSSPTIRIERFTSNIYISFSDAEQTVGLYERLLEAVQAIE